MPLQAFPYPVKSSFPIFFMTQEHKHLIDLNPWNRLVLAPKWLCGECSRPFRRQIQCQECPEYIPIRPPRTCITLYSIERFCNLPAKKSIGRKGGRFPSEGSKRESHLSPQSSPRTGRAKRIRPLLMSFMVFLSIPNVRDPCERKLDNDHPAVPPTPRTQIHMRLILQQGF